MLKRMSARQFEEWIAYFDLEPFGDDWLRTATLASLVANSNRDTEKRPEPFTPEEFLPIQRQPEAPESEEDLDAGWKRNKEILTMLMESKHA